MKIIGGTASLTTAEELAKLLNKPLVDTELKRFPDGELYLRVLQSVQNEHVVVVQTTYPDDCIIELLLLLDALKRANAETITVVVPYFGYGRQDRRFKEGEPICAQLMATLISLNCDRVITIDPHKEHILDFFTVPAYSLSAVGLLSSYLRDKKIDVVLAPDKGALTRAQDAAASLHCDVDYLEKTRLDGTTVRISPKSLNVRNKNVAIIDDIISTGGTMALSIQELKKQKARKIYVSCTHGLFVGNAIEKLCTAGCDEIISTDTIHSSFSIVKIASLIERGVKEFSR
jgi:ribose-phosphate pyrophosphokinase